MNVISKVVLELNLYMILRCCRHNTQEMELKKFLMTVHAGNVDKQQHYNVAVIIDDSVELKVVEIIEGKRHCVQRSFCFDTRVKKPQGTTSL